MADDMKIETKHFPWGSFVEPVGEDSEASPIIGRVALGAGASQCDNPDCKHGGCLSVSINIDMPGLEFDLRFDAEVARAFAEELLAVCLRQEADIAIKNGKMN